MEPNNPDITVITLVYNSGMFIRETIQSVLNQTFGDFEFIIIDDGSTDNSLEVIRSFNDLRIVILTNTKNCGIVSTRNRATSVARGRYVAILDSDDVAEPTRLETQRTVMELDKSIGLVASWVDLINASGDRIGKNPRRKFKPLELNVSLLFYNPIGHSSILFRSMATSKSPYSSSVPLCEDYLFISEIANSWKIEMIPKVLTRIRIHQKNISRLQQDLMHECELKVIAIILQNAKVRCSIEELRLHQQMLNGSSTFSQSDFVTTFDWLRSLVHQLRANNPNFHNALFPTVLGEIIWNFCQRGSIWGFPAVSLYVRTCCRFRLKIKLFRVIKLALKAVISPITRSKCKRSIDGNPPVN